MREKIKDILTTMGVLVIANILGNLIFCCIHRNINSLEELETLDDGYDDLANNFTEGE